MSIIKCFWWSFNRILLLVSQFFP